MSTPAPARYGSPLTASEIVIIRLAAAGLTNQAIGERAYITENTVKTHLQRIYRCLGATNRTHAVGLARKAGLIADPDVQPAPRP